MGFHARFAPIPLVEDNNWRDESQHRLNICMRVVTEERSFEKEPRMNDIHDVSDMEAITYAASKLDAAARAVRILSPRCI